MRARGHLIAIIACLGLALAAHLLGGGGSHRTPPAAAISAGR